jgi:serine/threonine-protein kinase
MFLSVMLPGMTVVEEGNARPGGAQRPMTVGRYTLYDSISAGGMGQVHFGRLRGANGFTRIVAIKRLHAQFAADAEFAARFLDEAHLAARIHHPNVVATIDAVSDNGELFLVMEYVAGESLARLQRTLTQARTRMPVAHAMAILVGALHGLHAAHEACNAAGDSLALVHRDISPQNILVGADGIARIIDFGIAKAAERLHVTRGEQVHGKLGYMAPEQLAGRPIDRRADIYAASVVLWELLVGQRLLARDGDSPAALLLAAQGLIPEPPSALSSEVPRALDDIVLRGLARDPALRFPTALEMATALEGVLVPSSQGEVGAWVRAEACETLRERQNALKRIETAPDAIGERRSSPRGALGRGSFPPTVAPQSEGALDGTPTLRRRSYLRPIAASVALAALGLAWMGGSVYGRMQRADPQHSNGSAATMDSAPTTVTMPTEPSVSGAGSSATAVNPEGTPPSAEPHANPTAAAPTGSHAPRPKGPSCNPPYRVDHGIKVAKVECL